MRKSAKALGLVVVSFLGAIALAVGSAFTAALSFGAVGLFVPGTGTPNANGVADYLSNARDRYTFNTPCSTEANCPTALEDPANASLQGINYPASFFPLVIIPNWCRSGPDGCDKWDDSVGQGTAALNAALAPYLETTSTEGVTIFGYSQGGAVVSNVLNTLGGVDQSVKDRLKVVTIGGIENPDGGLWSRLGFLPTIPFLDITFGPPMPTNTGIDTTAIGFEYDPVTYAPRYFGNALAVLNAFAALETVHGYYLAPNGNGPDETLPYGYTPTTLADNLNCSKNSGNCRYGQTVGTKNTYIMIPATTLPIFDLVLGAVPAPLKPLVQPIVNLLTPVTKLLIDLGYDWSGDPDKPTPLSILPFNPLTFNPVDFAVKFVGAIAQGVQDALRGGPLPAVTTSVPTTTKLVSATESTVAAAATTPQVSKLELVASTSTQPVTSAEASGSTVSKKVDPVVPETDAATVSPVESVTPPADLPVAADANSSAPAVVTMDEPKVSTDPVVTHETTDDATDAKSDTTEATKNDEKAGKGAKLSAASDTKAKDTKADDGKKDDAKDTMDSVKKDEPKKDSVTKGEPKKDSVTKGEPKKDEPKKDSDAGGADAPKKAAA